MKSSDWHEKFEGRTCVVGRHYLSGSSLCHTRRGSGMDTSQKRDESTVNIAYTPYPLSQLWSMDSAKSDVAPAGPIARTMDAASCAMPLVAPSDRLFGAALVT